MGDAARGAPRVFIAENVDPRTLRSILALAPPDRTCVNVISKSGTTIETLAQFLVMLEVAQGALGPRWSERFLVTTDPSRGFLRRFADRHHLRTLAIPPAVGGRFSVLTPVGLLPAAVAGVDIDELLAGAERMDERCRARTWKDNPGLALAAVHFLMDRIKGKGICVLMPYSDSLRSFADWFCQLWAESLGKRHTRTGDARSPVGQTPVRAVGATDQHSQLQLYVEGPNDKLLTLMEVMDHGGEVAIPSLDLPELAEEGLEHVAGHGIGELLNLERGATELVLRTEQRPVMNLELPDLSAYTLGQLFYLYEWATIAAGMLYHVDPFDQPGVEEGKRLTHAALGRAGLEEVRARLEAHRSQQGRFRV
jgi:glucose-6-phosphate isomerase